MNRKKKEKKVLGVYIVKFKTYTRYFGVADEKQSTKILRGRFEKRVWETLV